MAIEFTDRYGGNPPSWLRGCHDDCEAMGYVPVEGGRGPETLIATATYKLLRGGEVTVEYDRLAPCRGCGVARG